MSDVLSTINDEVAEFVTENTKVKDNSLRFKRGGHQVTWENLTAKLTPLRLSITPEQFDALTALSLEAHAAERQAITEGDFFHDPVELCSHFFNQWEVVVGGDECITFVDVHAGRVPITVPKLVSKLKIELYKYDRSIPIDPETGDKVVAPLKADGLLQPCVERLVSEVKYKAIGKARDAIKYNPDSKFPLDDWVKELLDIYGINHDEIPSHVLMFKHLLYNIKRGVFGNRDKELHPMYIFYSRKQGTGKTTLLEKLCSPFPYAYSSNGVLAKLLKGKEAKAMLRDKALVDFQELATPRSIRTDHGEIDPGVIADIKRAITTKEVEDRGMYTSENEKESIQAAFVSSSNIHIFDILQDPGGMRRYWEFELGNDQGVIKKDKWEAANKLFNCMTEVYQCIDENDSMGYFHDNCEYINDIERIQDNYSKEDAFSKFCELEGIEVQGFKEEGFTQVTVPRFAKRFEKFQEKQGNKKWATSTVLMLMSQKDILPDRIAKDGKVIEYFYVREKGTDNA